jgi:hypothetical protein
MKRIAIFLTIILIITTKIAFCEPRITAISGNFVHNSNLMISGLEFGVKSPATPLLWDSGSSAPSLSEYYDAWLPTNAQQGSDFNMQYRQVGFRGVPGPNSRTRYFLAGAHAVAASMGRYNNGINVGVGKNITSYNYYLHYSYRIDPLFDANNSGMADNMKEIVLSNTRGDFYPSYGFGYVDWCNSYVPNVNQKADVRLSAIDPFQCGYWKCEENGNELDHNNPINDWVKMEWVGGVDSSTGKPKISLTTYPDHRTTNRSYYGNWITTYEYSTGEYCGRPDNNNLTFIGIGGFARDPRANNGINSFRYFANVYMDITRARVMLGDNENINSCTKMEPQIPIAWSSDSISVTVNLGSFNENSTAYLFVFDSNNNHNITGIPVLIGGTALAPRAPENLRIVQ